VLYLLRGNSNNPQIINDYNRYCSLLRNVIVEAKKMHIHDQIHNSTNKIITAWEIIKNCTGSSRFMTQLLKLILKLVQ
jgi:hypothetical protein